MGPLIVAFVVFMMGVSAAGAQEDAMHASLTGTPGDAQTAHAFLTALVTDLKVPRLAHWGLTAADYAAVIPAARRAGSMQGNPVVLSDEQLTAVLDRS